MEEKTKNINPKKTKEYLQSLSTGELLDRGLLSLKNYLEEKPEVLTFLDAAEAVLREAKKPLHYSEIMKKSFEKRLLQSQGKTPHATLIAQIGTDIKKRKERGEPERFVKLGKGNYTLAAEDNILKIITDKNQEIRKNILEYIYSHDWKIFEQITAKVLTLLDFEYVEQTQYTNDKGIDVIGKINLFESLSITAIAQAKRWDAAIGRPDIQKFIGSMMTNHVRFGFFITTSSFQKNAGEAIQEALKEGIYIIPVDGKKLTDILIRNSIGSREKALLLEFNEESLKKFIEGSED